MRGMRVKKLRAVYRELVERGQAPQDEFKRHFRYFKKLYTSRVLIKFLPSL